MYRGFDISVRGSSHVKDDLKCQDSSVHLIEENVGWALTAVADGHGGKQYFRSEIGSQFAVESAVTVAKDYLADMDTFLDVLRKDKEKVLRGMEASILSKWNTAVQGYDAANFELTEWEQDWCKRKGVSVLDKNRENMYGTTLVLTILSPNFAIGIQNGDGACVAIYEDGTSDFFLPQEDGEQLLNMTNSLCSSKAMEHFEHRCDIYNVGIDEEQPKEKSLVQIYGDILDECPAANEEPIETEEEYYARINRSDCPMPTAMKSYMTFMRSPIPVCMITSTDGLINSCVSPEDFLKFNRRVLSLMDEENITEKLEAHLFNERSSKGSTDDISISLTFNKDIDLAKFRLS